MSKKKVQKPRTNYEVYRSIRKDWGDVNPVTRVETDRRFKKPKHIKREREKYFEEGYL